MCCWGISCRILLINTEKSQYNAIIGHRVVQYMPIQSRRNKIFDFWGCTIMRDNDTSLLGTNTNTHMIERERAVRHHWWNHDETDGLLCVLLQARWNHNFISETNKRHHNYEHGWPFCRQGSQEYQAHTSLRAEAPVGCLQSLPKARRAYDGEFQANKKQQLN